ncbi:MAG: GAF domain-containing protein [Polaromonas sp.]|nr:GAF domain-containing protein [Polaromonas sp.]
MKIAPFADNEDQRLVAMRAAGCAYVPREERFDRITRTAKRLLQVPIALVSIVEHDEQWFRSVQGLEVSYTPRDISFCGHAVVRNEPLCIPDTWDDPDFLDNPLVLGPPGIRSYLGWPLEIAPGAVAGTLCVIDTMPRTFGQEDYDAMRDLASMAEAELKISAMSNLQSRLLMQLSILQRKGALDPLTGCWNIRGFRALLALGFEDARKNNTDLAVCCIHVNNLAEVAAAASYANQDAMTPLLAQVLRQRLPHQGALACLGVRDFCALIPFESLREQEDQMARLTSAFATVNLPDHKLLLEISLTTQIMTLSQFGLQATPDSLWGHALAASGRGNA